MSGGVHSFVDEGNRLQGYVAVLITNLLPAFLRRYLPPSSGYAKNDLLSNEPQKQTTGRHLREAPSTSLVRRVTTEEITRNVRVAEKCWAQFDL